MISNIPTLHLASFTQYTYFEIHPCCGVYSGFIPFYCLVIFHGMGLQFICSPVDGHLGIFQFYAITNKDPKNVCVYICSVMYDSL